MNELSRYMHNSQGPYQSALHGENTIRNAWQTIGEYTVETVYLTLLLDGLTRHY